jgi:uncharacterized protein
MHPKERILEDMKAAMKGGDAEKRDVLRMLNAALRQVEVDSRKELTEQDVFDILQKEAKKRRESIADAQKAGREDIAEKEQSELVIIETYLPTQMSQEELEAEVAKAIAEAGATTAKQMGAVMKILSPRVKNRADGKLVNDLVKAKLS